MSFSDETPFQINVPEEKIANLHAKLELATYPDELEGAGWKYGAPLADIKRLTQKWRSGYDWRKHEKALNEELPMFTRDIKVNDFGTLNIHYVHKKSKVIDAIPLLFCHGWPGSFFEVTKILPLLIDSSPEHPSFHVVAISLPGFGFSEAPRKQGFAATHYAEVAHKLMLALGYSEYVTQGGDWGFLITRRMGLEYGGKHSKAWHTNFPVVEPPTWRTPLAFLVNLLKPWSQEEKAGLERTEWFLTKSTGYYAEQTTQPQTLGYSLADSPVGLFSWIYTGLKNWTDDYQWSDDEVLTWISLYWFSRAGPAASVRIYFEVGEDFGGFKKIGRGPAIPSGVSYFPKELILPPARWFCNMNNVVFESHHKSGGHFAATEKPEELVQDLRNMFGKGGPAFAVVPGKTGYD